MLYLAACQRTVGLLDVGWPFVLMLWRSTCVAMKYAYFSVSDMQTVQGKSSWAKGSASNLRALGGGVHFNAAGTLPLELQKACLLSALRGQVLASSSNLAGDFS